VPRWCFGAAFLCCLTVQGFAADDLDLVAAKAFTDACLAPEPSFERTAAFSGQQNWKMLGQSNSDRNGTRETTWQIASSGRYQAILLVRAVIEPPNWDLFYCEVVLPGYRDTGKRIESSFKDEIGRRPGAKLRPERDMPDRKVLGYRDGPVLLSYYDGSHDPDGTPWVILTVMVNRKPKN
jgi:hypothetical protein